MNLSVEAGSGSHVGDSIPEYYRSGGDPLAPINGLEMEPLNSIEWERLIKKGGLRGLTIDLVSPDNELCRQSCVYCNRRGSSPEKTQPMPPEVVLGLFDAALKLRLPHFTLSGGEPFAWKGIDQEGGKWNTLTLLDEFSKRKRNTPPIGNEEYNRRKSPRIKIFTNGMYFLGPEKLISFADFKQRYPQVSLEISLDTFDREKYAELKGTSPDQYKALWTEVIPYLTPNDKVHMTVTSLNYQEIPKFLDYFYSQEPPIPVDLEFVSLRGRAAGPNFESRYGLNETQMREAVAMSKATHEKHGFRLWKENSLMPPFVWQNMLPFSHIGLRWTDERLALTEFYEQQALPLLPIERKILTTMPSCDYPDALDIQTIQLWEGPRFGTMKRKGIDLTVLEELSDLILGDEKFLGSSWGRIDPLRKLDVRVQALNRGWRYLSERNPDFLSLWKGLPFEDKTKPFLAVILFLANGIKTGDPRDIVFYLQRVGEWRSLLEKKELIDWLITRAKETLSWSAERFLVGDMTESDIRWGPYLKKTSS